MEIIEILKTHEIIFGSCLYFLATLLAASIVRGYQLRKGCHRHPAVARYAGLVTVT